MGVQQPVSQLQATKAFGNIQEYANNTLSIGQFLAERKNYKKPNFIRHILRIPEKSKR